MKYLAAQKTKKVAKAQEVPRGKQTVKKLIGQNQGVANIEITDKNIKSFESVARKYGVDFAVKKDRSEPVPKYLVFFKARDADALTAAFKEFSAKTISKSQRPSVLALLRQIQSKTSEKVADRVKDKAKEVTR